MSEWRKIRLNDLVEEIIDRRGVTPLKLGSNFTTSGYRVISAKLVKNNRIDLSSDVARYVDRSTYLKWMKTPLKSDDVILTSEAPIGETAYLREDAEWCLGQRLFCIRTKKEIMNGRFLFYCLQYENTRHELLSRATGTTAQGISQESLRQALIPIPPLPEQKAIAHILGSLDDKIELNRRMNETLEAMARAIFKDWFVDFGPTRAKIEGRAPYLPEPIWSLFPDAINPQSGLPVGWKLGTIGECFNLLMGQSPPGETYNDNRQGLPFFQGRTDFGFRFPENRKYCTSPTRIAEANDTLVSVRAPVGDINMAWEKCCIGRGIASLRHKSGSPSFTYYSAWAIQQELFNYEHTGTVFGSITKNQLMSLSTIEPSQDFLKLFDEYVFPIDESIRVNVLKSRTLAEMRDRLLPKLMSGQIRVKDAEKLVEEVL
jgi:type I restriction enzyme S subunit